jgi:hypothetical protein
MEKITKDLEKEIEEIILKLIGDYYIPEGKTTEKAITQLLSLFKEYCPKIIGEGKKEFPQCPECAKLTGGFCSEHNKTFMIED